MTDGDVYVITGGAGGMGLATAKVLAPRGRVLLLDINDQALEAAHASLADAGIDVGVMRCDVTSTSDTSAVPNRIRELGSFRAVVHTAGLSPLMADGRRVLDVDLLGTVRILDALTPLLAPGVAAVLIASIAVYAPIPAEVEQLLDDPGAEGFIDAVEKQLGGDIDPGIAYMVAKRGVVRLAERLATPWGRQGARVVAVLPGLIDTAMGQSELKEQEMMPIMAEMTPIQRPGQQLPGRPEDIAEAAAWLVSDQASFVSGCELRVDGGLIGATR